MRKDIKLVVTLSDLKDCQFQQRTFSITMMNHLTN